MFKSKNKIVITILKDLALGMLMWAIIMSMSMTMSMTTLCLCLCHDYVYEDNRTLDKPSALASLFYAILGSQHNWDLGLGLGVENHLLNLITRRLCC